MLYVCLAEGENIPHYRTISKYEERIWNRFQTEGTSKYNFLQEGKIRMSPYKFTNCRSSFETWLKDVKKADQPKSVPYNCLILQVLTRLSSNKKSLDARRNADLREFKVFNDYYLVKNLFTFGFQTVKPKTFHIFATTNKGLDLFFPIDDDSANFSDNFIPPASEKYRRETIPPNRCCKIGPGTKYIMISRQKTVFYFKIYVEPMVC